MSEPTTEIIPYSEERVVKLKNFLAKAKDAAVSELQLIQKIESDGEYAEAEATLSEAKDLYAAMVAKRKALTDPIKAAIEAIMTYENAINPDAKTENEYRRARKVLEDYNQAKINEKNEQEKIAKHRAELIKYRADFKAEVQKSLSSRIAGLHKTAIQNFGRWEAGLTLENFDKNVEAMRNAQPALKPEYYQECFKLWGNRPDLMSPEDEKNYLEELKTELPYESYNQEYQALLAPLKNEYLARVPVMKANLEAVQKQTDEKAKTDLLKKQEDDRKAAEKTALAEANKIQNDNLQTIADSQALGHMEGDFTAQAMTQDNDAGPSKMVFRFESDVLWLPAFLQVVSKCAAHPKFKGIAKGEGYIPEVQKWMDFYSSNIKEPMKGLTASEKAKTIIRKEKL